jgi:hypothetical protein
VEWVPVRGIERGALVEAVGEGFLGGLVLLGPAGTHAELGLGWSASSVLEKRKNLNIRLTYRDYGVFFSTNVKRIH